MKKQIFILTVVSFLSLETNAASFLTYKNRISSYATGIASPIISEVVEEGGDVLAFVNPPLGDSYASDLAEYQAFMASMGIAIDPGTDPYFSSAGEDVTTEYLTLQADIPEIDEDDAVDLESLFLEANEDGEDAVMEEFVSFNQDALENYFEEADLKMEKDPSINPKEGVAFLIPLNADGSERCAYQAKYNADSQKVAGTVPDSLNACFEGAAAINVTVYFYDDELGIITRESYIPGEGLTEDQTINEESTDFANTLTGYYEKGLEVSFADFLGFEDMGNVSSSTDWEELDQKVVAVIAACDHGYDISNEEDRNDFLADYFESEVDEDVEYAFQIYNAFNLSLKTRPDIKATYDLVGAEGEDGISYEMVSNWDTNAINEMCFGLYF